MPVVNHVVLASGAVVAVSVAVAAALAMYENPDLRRYADDIRRRIAVAFHTLGDGINPPERAPRFNRPEDADGFLQPSRGMGAEPGVDADDETRRRQREELLYWNSVRLRKQEQETAGLDAAAESSPVRPLPASRGSSFDDFLRRDEDAEQGAYVFKTGADLQAGNPGLRHRGLASSAAATASLYANPFADEHFISNDEVADTGDTYTASGPPPRPPKKEEHMSDIYSATTREHDDDADDIRSNTLDGSPALIELPSSHALPSSPQILAHSQHAHGSLGQEDIPPDAYASIQAWAQDSSRNFYSPLPETPVAPVSEADVVSDEQLMPTDSMSIIGSQEDLGHGSQASLRAEGDKGRAYDVLSESEGMLTPASWSEVGSVVSDEAHAAVRG